MWETLLCPFLCEPLPGSTNTCQYRVEQSERARAAIIEIRRSAELGSPNLGAMLLISHLVCACAEKTRERSSIFVRAEPASYRWGPQLWDNTLETTFRQLGDNLMTNYQRRQDSGAASLQKHPIDEDDDEDGLAAPKPIYAGAVWRQTVSCRLNKKSFWQSLKTG